MLKKLVLICFIALLSVACKQTASQAPLASDVISQSANASIEQAFKERKSHVEVEGQGIVIKLLPDDTKGLRHQKFLVKISPEQTLLFAHNLDLAARVEPLNVGDTVEFKGEYVYNPKGGIVHWTHKAPQGDHAAGWIKLDGKLFQ